MPTSGRRPAARPPPPDNPIIESWLDTMPPATMPPSRAELREWKLDDYGAWGRIWTYSSIVLRVFSFLFAFVIIFLGIVLARDGLDLSQIVPPLVLGPMVTLWDTTEFSLLRFRGRGMPMRLHAGVDLIVFLGAGASTIAIIVDIVIDTSAFGLASRHLSVEFAQVSLLIGLAAVHAVMFFLYLCNSIDRRGQQLQKSGERIMYRTSGEPGFTDVPLDPWLPTEECAGAQERTLDGRSKPQFAQHYITDRNDPDLEFGLEFTAPSKPDATHQPKAGRDELN